MPEDKNTITIKAVHDDDLKPVLKKLGLWEGVKQGTLKCLSCGKAITYDNIGGLKKVKGEVGLICDNLLCLLD